MSSRLRNREVSLAVWIGLGAAGILAAPVACLYPDYSFDAPEPSSSSSGPGGGATTSSTSSAGVDEDCVNGVDDNGDNLIDCADPACGSFACVPEVPEGWTGHFALYDGVPAQDPGCPMEFPSTTTPAYVASRGLLATPASCHCSCGPAEGQTCDSLATLVITASDAPCGETPHCVGDLTTPGWTGTCQGPNGFSGGQLTCGPTGNCETMTGAPCNVSITIPPLVARGGACAPGQVEVDKPDVAWESLGRACAAAESDGRGCNLGQVCLPAPSAPFESGVCIAKDGDNACPPGAFTEKHVFFSGVEDNRGCTSDCRCSPPTNGSCPTNVSIYSNPQLNSCTTLLTSIPAGSCVNITGNPAVVGRSASPPGDPTGGQCTPSGGTPTGEAEATSPRTFCCVP